MAAPQRQPEEAIDDTEFIDDHHDHHRDSVHTRLRANSAIMQFQKILVANRGVCVISLLIILSVVAYLSTK